MRSGECSLNHLKVTKTSFKGASQQSVIFYAFVMTQAQLGNPQTHNIHLPASATGAARRSFTNLSRIYQRSIKDPSQIQHRLAKDPQEICHRFTTDLPQIYHKSATVLPQTYRSIATRNSIFFSSQNNIIFITDLSSLFGCFLQIC